MPLSTALPLTAHAVDANQHTCPLCRGETIRTWRRPIDRFTTFFVPVHRYRCEDFSCQWEGNFRTHETQSQAISASARESHSKGTSALFVVGFLIVVAATLFITALSTSDSWSASGSGTTGQ